MTAVRRPCLSCPWRVDETAQDIPNFRLELAEQLANTCPDARDMGPNFGAPQFACHQSRPGEEVVRARTADNRQRRARVGVVVPTLAHDEAYDPPAVLSRLRATLHSRFRSALPGRD